MKAGPGGVKGGNLRLIMKQYLGLGSVKGVELPFLFQDHKTVSYRALNRLNPLHFHIYKL